ncbi:hypothetical protein EDC04DRAFT_2609903 [Pisolithus marmoratus]|nr:hypothetical protein EDC04DRAFT_2609903 [Pisolithus marmoratus]
MWLASSSSVSYCCLLLDALCLMDDPPCFGVMTGRVQFEVPLSSLPCFLVLLAMQRVEDRHWGLNPYIDAKFGTCLNSYQMILGDEQARNIDVTIELLSEERVADFSLNDRATSLFPATGKAFPVRTVSLPKFFGQKKRARTSPKFQESTPVYFHRSDLEPTWPNDRWNSHSISDPVSETEAKNQAYQDRFFARMVGDGEIGCRMEGSWMCDPNNFDLVSVEDGPTGTDVPARSHSWHWLSLKKGSKSFIWVLTWITLRYDSGVLRTTGRPLDDWLTIDRSTCVVKKTAFPHQHARRQLQAGIGHEGNLEVALGLFLSRAKSTSSVTSSHIVATKMATSLALHKRGGVLP